MIAEYIPIACIEHERLEFAVLRRQHLRLSFRLEDGSEYCETLLPTDVYTRDGAEWLEFKTANGEQGKLRLDCILSICPAAGQ